jgi:hypothetical protein
VIKPPTLLVSQLTGHIESSGVFVYLGRCQSVISVSAGLFLFQFVCFSVFDAQVCFLLLLLLLQVSMVRSAAFSFALILLTKKPTVTGPAMVQRVTAQMMTKNMSSSLEPAPPPVKERVPEL